MVDDSFFCISAVLDPSFKLKWCHDEEKKLAVKQMVEDELQKECMFVQATAADNTSSKC